MEKIPRMPRFSRRELLIGSTALAAGILVTLGGVAAVEQMNQKDRLSPLTPENGDAESKLVIEWLPDTVSRWKPKIETYSHDYEIDPNLLAIMMTIESGGDPHADSGSAKGLMQISKGTAGDIAAKYLRRTHRDSDADLTNPDTSIEFGAAYIRYLIDEFGNPDQGPSWDETVTLVAAGYNGGPGAAQHYQEAKWKGLEDYAHETFTYARYVRVMWQERHDPLSFTYRYWYDTANGKALVENASRYKLP
jgi:hypothetical protein